VNRAHWLCAVAVLATLGATPGAQAGGEPWNGAQIARLKSSVDAALDSPTLRGAHVGFFAVDSARGTVLDARNAGDEFAPASNFKLLVGSAALRDLGPSFRFVTTLASDAAPQAGAIAGNLYLRGGGDAHLSAADLRDAALAVFRAGVRRVDGALITDASHDDAAPLAPGWSWDDLSYDYAAPVSALELEEGVVHVYVSPGTVAGAPVTLRVEPPSDVFAIEDRATTGPARSEDSTDVERVASSPKTIRVIGSYPLGAPESGDLAPSVPDPEAYAGDVLLRALASIGITVAGGVRGGIAPRGAVTLWRLHSAPMPQLLAEFWQPSDNLMGELFLKELGVGRAGEPGTAANGFAAEREYLRSIGVDASTLSLADGSGLSVYDRITPRDLVEILQSDWNGAQREAIVDALPEAGVRGTLRDAFSGTGLATHVFAKTGSARHVRALSGYVRSGLHGPVTFSFIVNDWLGDDGPSGAAAIRAVEAALLYSIRSKAE
jgi:serine-type D-Ala-D-Ala carboxypeptidase/endopeptidase (penicillin-binding protein 4)